MAKSKVIELAGQKYDADWLRSVPLNKAINVLKNCHDKNQVTNAWKQANGLSVRNYNKAGEKVEAKAPAKKARKAPTKKSSK